jgi:non-specific serine/threonine protein kinase
VVNKDNAPHIAQICHRLDGIPLAIELAAARVKVLSVEQISKRLDDRFRLLTGGARTALPRQQTLRALIDWSYDLLTENERLLLTRLSVFAGGWTLEAAEEVCIGQNVILSYDILDLLTQLVNKSLVVVIEHSQSGETRYRMLETIRQYAREKLLEAGGSEVIRDKHLAYFVNLAEQAEPELIRSNQVFWLNRLDDELDNLRIALEWALERNVEAGLRIATVLWQFWQSRGYLAELGNWLGQLLKHYELANSLHVRALAAYSIYTRSRSIAEQSLQMARTLSDRQSEALSLMNLGVIISVQQGDLREGLPVIEQSLALFRELGDTLNQAYATGWLSLNNNDLEHTKALVIESLRLFRQLGHLWGIASSLRQLATLTIWGGDFSSPTPWLEEARTIFRQLGDQLREAQILELYGGLAFWVGDFQKACAYYEEAITLEKKVGSDLDSDWTHTHMAYAVLRQGDITQAKEKFKFCVQHFQNTENMGGLVFAMEGLASLNINQDQPCRATLRLGRCHAREDK